MVVFFLSEELPTILLTVAIQMAFNMTVIAEYSDAFGVSDVSSIPQQEYNARRVECIWELFQSDVSGFINGMSSFFAFL